MAIEVLGIPTKKIVLWARYAAEGSLIAAIGFYLFSTDPSSIWNTIAKTALFWIAIFAVGLICLWFVHRSSRATGRAPDSSSE